MRLSAWFPRVPSFQLRVAACTTDFVFRFYSVFLSDVIFYLFGEPPIAFQTACSDTNTGAAYSFTAGADLNLLPDRSQCHSLSTLCWRMLSEVM